MSNIRKEVQNLITEIQKEIDKNPILREETLVFDYETPYESIRKQSTIGNNINIPKLQHQPEPAIIKKEELKESSDAVLITLESNELSDNVNIPVPTLNEHILLHMIREGYIDNETLINICDINKNLESFINSKYPLLYLNKIEFFKNSSLSIEKAVTLLTTSPAGRDGETRLTVEQQEQFIKLVSKKAEERTVQDLYNAGIIRPDECKDSIEAEEIIDEETISGIRTDKFLAQWLETGYVSRIVQDELGLENLGNINMSYAVITEMNCNVEECYLLKAKLDNSWFYKANFCDAVLEGATMYNSSVSDCNRTRDNDYPVVEELIEAGVIGLSLNDYLDEM